MATYDRGTVTRMSDRSLNALPLILISRFYPSNLFWHRHALTNWPMGQSSEFFSRLGSLLCFIMEPFSSIRVAISVIEACNYHHKWGPVILLAESQKGLEKVTENRKSHIKSAEIRKKDLAGNRENPYLSHGKPEKFRKRHGKSIFKAVENPKR